MTAWDVFFGVLAAVVVVMVFTSVIGRVASGKVVTRNLHDWRDYVQMAASLLIVFSWFAGTIASVMALVALAVYFILYFKTSRNSRSQ